MLLFLIFLIAIFTSVISALIGIGGGLVLVPSLATLAQLPHIHAVGTALASMSLFSAVASYKNHRNNYIVWSAAAFIAAGSIAGAYLGAQVSIRIPLLTWKIGFIIIAVYLAYNMFYQQKNRNNILSAVYNFLNKFPLHRYSENAGHEISITGFVAFGIIVGITSSIMGLGGGFLTTPYFMLGMRLAPKKAVATSLLIIFITSFSGAATHISLGHFSLTFWGAATAGMAIGGYMGAGILKKIPDHYIKMIFSGIILVSIILILLK